MRTDRLQTAVAVSLAAALAFAGAARAENECGAPEAGEEVVCSPSTYNPAEGNIFYGHDENGRDETSEDFTIRLTEDLSIDYDRERPGDDVYISLLDGNPIYSAIWIAPGEFGEYTGNVSLYSAADVTSNARGIFAGHYGKSGALRLEISGGVIATTGAGFHAVHGDLYEGSAGALDLIVRGATIGTTGTRAFGVLAVYVGEGDATLSAQDSAIATAGDGGFGLFARHGGDGDVTLTTQDITVATAGTGAGGIYADHEGTGDVSIAARDLDITTAGESALGIIGFHLNEGDVNITVRSAAIATAGHNANSIYADHYGTGDVNLTAEDLDITIAGDRANGIVGYHRGEGDMNIAAREIDYATTGIHSYGIYVEHHGTGELNIDAQRLDIDTAGGLADGVFGWHRGSGELTIDARNLDIETAGEFANGVHATHTGAGALEVHLRDTTIATTGNTHSLIAQHLGEGSLELFARNLVVTSAGEGLNSVYAKHEGAGDLNLTAQDLAVTSTGDNAYGVYGWHQGGGDVNLDVRGSVVSTAGDFAYGVYGRHEDEGELHDGKLKMDALNLDITTKGDDAYGIFGSHGNKGELSITAQGVSITTAGERADGVTAIHTGAGALEVHLRDTTIAATGAGATGLYSHHQGEGSLELFARNLVVTTTGDGADSIIGWHQGAGELKIDARNLTIATAGDRADGILGLHEGAGDLNITAPGVSIATAGEGARGIYGAHYFMTGDAAIRVHDGAVTTVGANAHGVQALHLGAGLLEVDLRDTTIIATGAGAHGVAGAHGGSGSVRIAIEGGSVHASGAEASGVRMGGRLAEDGTVSLAALPGEDGYRKQSVEVNAPVTGGSGENAAGVFLGGGGRVAIGPKGSVGAASRVAILASGGAPRLHVEMDLDGRRVEQVIGESWIINDGGETTLRVNGVTLHEGAAGATGAETANGAWDLTLSASETIQGRAFTPGDFIETYAPRAAVYEALPGVLQRLERRGTTSQRLRRPGLPAWVRVSGGRGSHGPDRASIGAAYDFDRFAVETGVDFRLSETGDLTGSASLRHVRGSADVSAPTGGGAIEAEGTGVSFGAAWRNDAGTYGDGRVSLMRYEADLRSSARGWLKEGARATARTLRVEAGRRLAVGATVHLTPRAWLARTDVSLDGFRDAVGSRVALDEAGRTDAGIGIVAGRVDAWDAGERILTLRGELGVERTLGSAETGVEVSGERLHSGATASRMKLGLDGEYRWGKYMLGAAVSASGLGSDDSEHTANLRFGMRF